MSKVNPTHDEIPIEVVGSTVFGRYPKISVEQTFNMIISDGFLVPFAGHQKVNPYSLGETGRGIYSSSKGGFIILVVDEYVYKVNSNLNFERIANLSSSNGDVFIAEDNASNIAICDKKNIYIYNYSDSAGGFYTITLDFIPGYITFGTGQFIASVLNPDPENLGFWRLSDYDDNSFVFFPTAGSTDPVGPNYVGDFQTKGDVVQAVIPLPSRGNNVLVFGKIVTELWVQAGLPAFPYQKNTAYNLDYGCINPATIAWLDKYVVWVGGNQQAGATIMFTDGSEIQQISNDGINFKLAELTKPQDCYGFLFRQDGHLFYVVTFYTDNLSYAYDFNTQKFFTLTDENGNYYVAQKVVFFNNKYYFISINDGNFYELSSTIYTYDGHEIPRVRICKNFRLPDASRFAINMITFTIEEGESDEIQYVQLSYSKDGGQSFSSMDTKQLNQLGKRQNRLRFWSKGVANDFAMQFRFYMKTRAVMTNGVMSIYQ